MTRPNGEEIKSHIWTTITDIKDKTVGVIKEKGKKVIVDIVATEVSKIPIIGGPISEYIKEKYIDDTEIEVKNIEKFLVDLRDCEEERFEFIVDKLEYMNEHIYRYHNEITETIELMMGGIDRNFEYLKNILSEMSVVKEKLKNHDEEVKERFEEVKTEISEMKRDHEKQINELTCMLKRFVPDIIDKDIKHHFNPVEEKIIKEAKDITNEYEINYDEILLDPELYFRLGNAEYIKDNFEQSIYNLDKVIEINPEDIYAWSNKGVALRKLQRYEEALECFNKALNINPDFELLWNNKGTVLADLGRYGEALECYDKALEINPEYAKAWYNKGDALGELGQYDKALEYSDKALEINPEYAKAWNNKGNAFLGLGQITEALECYDKELKINPEYANAWYNKGAALEDLARYDEALECYDKALEINPEYAKAWYNKGAILGKLEKNEDAKNCFEMAKKYGSDPHRIN